MLGGIHNFCSKFIFILAIALIAYMPMHVFIAQSASLLTGGLDMWKAAKDIIVILLVPFLLWLAYKKKVFTGKFKWHFLLGFSYVLLHLIFVIFDSNDDTYSSIVASVYNTRILIYMLIGLLIGTSQDSKKYLKFILTTVVLIASFVALLGVLQYFLPSDLLTHVGYSIERGVKPLFFIDDKPDLPRVMSTLKDPNSFGAYLILPILFTGYALIRPKLNAALFVRPFRKEALISMLGLQMLALFLTFSRGALLGLILSIVTLLCIVTGNRAVRLTKKYWQLAIVFLVFVTASLVLVRDTYLFQNVVFHADESTVLADPNELRVSLTQNAIDSVVATPVGHGPGTAGLVAISNPQGGILTENYYLQIGYEVGWLGLLLFLAILSIVMCQLFKMVRSSNLSAILFSAGVAYLFYSLLIHLWSNEAVALQWWLLVGVSLALSPKKQTINN